MSIGQQEVEAISRLAALSVSDDEKTEVAGKLSNILDLFAQMEGVNTDDVAPMSHPLDQVQRLRLDEVTATDNHEKFQKIAPSTEGGLYLVPQVLD